MIAHSKKEFILGNLVDKACRNTGPVSTQGVMVVLQLSLAEVEEMGK